MSHLLGMKIVPHLLARDVRTTYSVERVAGAHLKKRKRWFVKRTDIDRPGCWQVGDTLYMHPELIARLPR